MRRLRPRADHRLSLATCFACLACLACHWPLATSLTPPALSEVAPIATHTRIIVTRPRAQALAWVEALHALGQPAQALPLIAIAPAADPAPVRAAWGQLPGCALVLFVSANAVEQFFAAAPPGAEWPPGVCAGSTGPGTSAALRAAGVAETCLAEPAADAPSYDSEALWARIGQSDWAGRRVLVVRGDEGRDWLADTLRARGATVDFLAAYRRRLPTLDREDRALLERAQAEPAAHLWQFSSSEAISNLQRLAPDADWSRSRALASHSRIAQTARDAGFGQVDRVPADPAAVAAMAAPTGPKQ